MSSMSHGTARGSPPPPMEVAAKGMQGYGGPTPEVALSGGSRGQQNHET